METQPNTMRQTRKALGITQVQLAERLAVSQPTIARMEADEAQIDQRTRLALSALSKLDEIEAGRRT